LVCSLIMGALKLHNYFKTGLFEYENGETGHV
jgi:hypothetical protein